MGQVVLDTDTFGGTNGNTLSTYNANWVLQSSGSRNECNIAGTPGVSGSLAGNYRTGFTWTNDHWAELKVGATIADFWFQVGVRMQTDDTASGYLFGMDNASFGTDYRLIRVDSGAETMLGSASGQTLAINDVVNLQIVGTVLTGFVNGIQVLTYDTSGDGTKYSTGKPGLQLYTTTTTTRLGGSWRAGSYGSAHAYPFDGPLAGLLGGNL
jgi:hypothetical protein